MYFFIISVKNCIVGPAVKTVIRVIAPNLPPNKTPAPVATSLSSSALYSGKLIPSVL